MRHKAAVEMQKTDKDLFANMDIGDPWIDASMVEVWKYLYHSKYLVIPDSWRQPMAEFDQQLTQLATDLPKLLIMLMEEILHHLGYIKVALNIK